YCLSVADRTMCLNRHYATCLGANFLANFSKLPCHIDVGTASRLAGLVIFHLERRLSSFWIIFGIIHQALALVFRRLSRHRLRVLLTPVAREGFPSCFSAADLCSQLSPRIAGLHNPDAHLPFLRGEARRTDRAS